MTIEDDDRRRQPRIQCDVRVDYCSPREVILDHALQNLSSGGACLEVVATPPVETQVVLWLNFPTRGYDPVDLKGTVVWTDSPKTEADQQMLRESVEIGAVGNWPEDAEPRKIGIRFTEVNARAKRMLEAYVNDQMEPPE